MVNDNSLRHGVSEENSSKPISELPEQNKDAEKSGSVQESETHGAMPDENESNDASQLKQQQQTPPAYNDSQQTQQAEHKATIPATSNSSLDQQRNFLSGLIAGASTAGSFLVDMTTRSILTQTQLFNLSSHFFVACTGLFNPYDRALFLALKVC